MPPSVRPRGLPPAVLLLLAVLATAVVGALNGRRLHHDVHALDLDDRSALAQRQSSAPSSVLEVYQLSPPVLTPANPACQQTLMVHVFAYSYGLPFIGKYEPPPCSFNRVSFNFTVTSAGRQYDRLGIMYLNDTEVWRISTAEPTAAGIHWTYFKDMSNFLPLFKEPQTIIFDLGNLVSDIYTGTFNTTLTATFFTEENTPPAADLILPVSARNSATNGTSVFEIPRDNATNTITLPQNIERATFSIAAAGQSAEEFWWGNVLSSEVATFGPNGTTLYGYSPWREVQLYIDGILAGVAWPFPVIFTGGIVPGFWRPIVGIDAYDLIEDEIDITPFLPLLCDGSAHSFELRVVGIDDDGNSHGTVSTTIGSYWLVTGKIFIWKSAPGSVTTGTRPVGTYPAPEISISSTIGKTSNGTNSTLTYAVSVSRTLSITSSITSNTTSKKATWTQSLTFSNDGHVSNSGNTQVNTQSTKGTAQSSTGYSRSFSYPLFVNQSYVPEFNSSSFGLEAVLDRAKDVVTFGPSAFPLGTQPAPNDTATSYPGSRLETRQNGTAVYTSIQGQPTSNSWGSTEQVLDFQGLQRGEEEGTELYRRHVLAVNYTLVVDDITYGGEAVEESVQEAPSNGAEKAYSDFAPAKLAQLKGFEQGGLEKRRERRG